jgi:NAD(P)H dehydrogenase (quinone)
MNQANLIILVLFYSRHGATRKLAELIATGNRKRAGLRRPSAHGSCRVHRGRSHRSRVPAEGAPYVEPEDLQECAGIAVGSPTRFGNMAAAMKYFWDGTATQWLSGALAGKPACVFTSTGSLHGGQESTLLSMMIPLFHHGLMVLGLPYTHPELMTTASGGTPYGASHWAGLDGKKSITDDEKKRRSHWGGGWPKPPSSCACRNKKPLMESRLQKFFHLGAIGSLITLISGVWRGNWCWRPSSRAARGWC